MKWNSALPRAAFVSLFDWHFFPLSFTRAVKPLYTPPIPPRPRVFWSASPLFRHKHVHIAAAVFCCHRVKRSMISKTDCFWKCGLIPLPRPSDGVSLFFSVVDPYSGYTFALISRWMPNERCVTRYRWFTANESTRKNRSRQSKRDYDTMTSSGGQSHEAGGGGKGVQGQASL